MKKKQKKSHSLFFIVIGTILLIILFLLLVKQNKQRSIKQTNYIHPTITLMNNVIAPTIMPSSKKGWNTFIYPDSSKKFSFDYPSSWNIKLTKMISDLPTIIFTYALGPKNYNFSINPEAHSEYNDKITTKDVVRNYGDRKINIKTFYSENEPFLVAIYFEDFNSEKDNIQVINMELPPSAQEEYQNILDQILASLKLNK